MKLLMKLTAVLLTAVALCGCSMWDYEEYASDITLDELQAMMNKASDPAGLYRNAKSYIQKQTSVVEGVFWDDEYVIEVKFKRPGSWKTVTYQDNQPLTGVIYDGRKAWIVDYRGKTATELKGHALARVRNMQTLLLPDSTFADTFERVQLSQVRVNGMEYYKVVGTNPGQEPITIYVGKYSGLPKRLATREKVGGITVNYEATMDTYAMYDHVIIANQNTVRVDNTRQVSRVILYRLNVDIDDSEFQPSF